MHHYEDAVLKGTALVLLDIPTSLRGAVVPLRRLFDDAYPRNGITHIFLNPSPVLSTSGEGVMECGAVFFSSANATWALLDKVEVVLRTEDGPLELRRGYLKLGDVSILVEGVLTWGANGRERPQQQQETNISEAAAPSSLPASMQASSSPNIESVSADPPVTPEARAHEEGTVVISIHFKEVYNRHRNLREERERMAHGELPSMFPLTPFMVYQTLIEECQPRKIVLIDSRRKTQQRIIKALIELESAEVATHAVCLFTHRAVEFVSEAEGGRRPERGQSELERSRPESRPICAEVRYYLNAYFSTQNGHRRFHPNGERNYHRTLTVNRQEKNTMNAVDPQDAALVSVRAPREWQRDAHAIRPTSVPDGKSPDCEEPAASGERKSRVAPSTTASLQVHQQAHQHQRQREDRFDRPWRSPPARYGRGGRRSHTRSRSRSHSPSVSSSRSVSTSSSSSSSRSRHFYRRPRHEEARRGGSDSRHGRSRSARGPGPHDDAPPFSSATATSSGHPSNTAFVVSRNLERPVEKTVVQAASAPPPPPPRMEVDSLPPGWRPIYSEEYKQTYYAYRDPQTGTETTTWERPGT